MGTQRKIDTDVRSLDRVFHDPARRHSLLLEVRHADVVAEIGLALGEAGRVISLPTILLSERVFVRGRLERVMQYDDGYVICLIPEKGGVCESWPIVPIWCPKEFGPTGVICLWTTNAGLGCPLTPDVFAPPEKVLTCPEPLRTAHHPSPWDNREWVRMRAMPWMVVDARESEKLLIVRTGQIDPAAKSWLGEVLKLQVAAPLEGRVIIEDEYLHFLGVEYERNAFSTRSFLAGMHASGRRLYKMLRQLPQHRGIYRYYDTDKMNEAEMDWHAYFLGYGLGQGIWGDIGRQCHNLAYHRGYTPEEVFRSWIPQFARSVYKSGDYSQFGGRRMHGRSTLTFAEFVLAKTKNVL